jgi:hypothetical protein
MREFVFALLRAFTTALRRIAGVASNWHSGSVDALGGQMEDSGLTFEGKTSICIGRKLGLC